MPTLSFARIVLLYGSLAATLTIFHGLQINLSGTWREGRDRFHEGIIHGDFKAPYQYRVVAPYTAEIGGRLISGVSGIEAWKAREIAYLVMRFVCIWLLLILFHQYSLNWLSPELSLAATLLFGGLHLYTFRGYFYQPSSVPHVLFMAAGVRWMLLGRTRVLYPLTAFASATRETSGLLVAFFLAQRWRQRGWLLHTTGLLATWLAVQLLLRLVFGWPEFFEARPLAVNFAPRNILWVAGLFGALWVVPLLRFRELPPFLQRGLVLVGPLLVVANLWFGKLEETRLFLELGLLLIPATFIALFGARSQHRGMGLGDTTAA